MKLRVKNPTQTNPDPIVDIWVEMNDCGEIVFRYAINGEHPNLFALINVGQTELLVYETDVKIMGLKLIKT